MGQNQRPSSISPDDGTGDEVFHLQLHLVVITRSHSFPQATEFRAMPQLIDYILVYLHYIYTHHRTLLITANYTYLNLGCNGFRYFFESGQNQIRPYIR